MARLHESTEGIMTDSGRKRNGGVEKVQQNQIMYVVAIDC